MNVLELIKLLEAMPHNANVYMPDGLGITEANLIFAANLVGVEYFCELVPFCQIATLQFQDSKIERETGFKNRDELIDQYKKLTKKPELGDDS